MNAVDETEARNVALSSRLTRAALRVVALVLPHPGHDPTDLAGLPGLIMRTLGDAKRRFRPDLVNLFEAALCGRRIQTSPVSEGHEDRQALRGATEKSVKNVSEKGTQD